MGLSVFVFVYAIGLVVCEQATVHTKLGTMLGTMVETSFNGKIGKVSRFLGIPYAEPPTGSRRFQKPVPKGQLPNPLDASDFGPACPQDLFMMMGWVPGYPYVDEDCLSLNVFVPENKSSTPITGSYAVMVWIHGGAYVIGQSKMYSAENLTLIGDVIVVTINYRLTSLGFLSTESEKFPGNYGLWDQQMALQWVHDNIADFGGDPSRVTIFGESAGGASVIYHSLYAGNKGLFQRLIADSGSPFCPWAYQSEPRKYARRLADKLGCTDPDLDAAVACLQGLDAMALVNNSRIGTEDETAFRAEWLPTYDGVIVQHTQSNLFASGLDLFKDIDIMLGFTNNDGAFVTLLSIQPYMMKMLNKTFDDGIPHSFFRNFYIPLYLKDKYGNSSQLLQDWVDFVYKDYRDVHNDFYTRERFLEFTADYYFLMPMLAVMRKHAEVSSRSRSFLFEFSARPTFNTSPAYVKGANHGEELPFVFGFPNLMADGMKYRNHIADWELELSEEMMTMWSNYAKTG